MYDEQNRSEESKSKIAFVAIIVGLIFLIIAISAIGVFINKSKTANITNESGNETGIISSEELNDVKNTINPTMQKLYETEDSLSGVVRWDTAKEEQLGEDNSRKEFIIDLDDIKQSYRVIIIDGEVFYDCPELKLSKYPDSFCIGTYRDYNDSISVVFGDSLPLRDSTDNGDLFSITRNRTMNTVDDRYLEIYSYSCPNDDATIARVNEKVDNIIESLGATPSMFERKIVASDCHGE